MKSTHLITSKATTTLIIHLTSFFHFSHSHADITLNPVTSIIIIAKKNAAALTADNTLNITELFQISAFVTHDIHCS